MACIEAKGVVNLLQSCLSNIESNVKALESTVEYLSVEQNPGNGKNRELYEDDETAKQVLDGIFGKFDDACEKCEQVSAICSMITLEKLVDAGSSLVESNESFLGFLDASIRTQCEDYKPFTTTSSLDDHKEKEEHRGTEKQEHNEAKENISYFPTPAKQRKEPRKRFTPLRMDHQIVSPADSNPPTPSLEDFGLSVNTVNLLQN